MAGRIQPKREAQNVILDGLWLPLDVPSMAERASRMAWQPQSQRRDMLREGLAPRHS